MKRYGEPLGFHGVVLASSDPKKDARAWATALRLPVLQASAREVVLGLGPSLFVALRRQNPGRGDLPIELHLAVKDLRTRGARADFLGGDSVVHPVSGGRLLLVLREFRRPPSGRWSPKRAKRARRSTRSGRARGPSIGRNRRG